MQHGLLYLPVHTHGVEVPAMLGIGPMQFFVSHKLASKLPDTIHTTTPLTVALPIGKTMVAT